MAYYNRGVQKILCEELNDAIADFNQAIRIKPNYVEAYVNRGQTKAVLGRTDEARVDFQKALELAEQQENIDAKTYVKEKLQQLSQAASKQSNKKSRRDG
ncbi:tetratricopeptide repeat protein [Candidatus Poribacteria bacterium]|nr:tetratricopeptide repeat protein [Candidatus Poribacteria bacterium]MYK21956.1 tetratricopeptide repeat protein [Candidatus Poribacteria bacterium]